MIGAITTFGHDILYLPTDAIARLGQGSQETGVVYNYTHKIQQDITLVIDPLRVGTDIAHDRSTHVIRIGDIWVQELQERGFVSNRQQFGDPDKKLTLIVDDADDKKLIQKNRLILVEAFAIQRRDLSKRLANLVPISN